MLAPTLTQATSTPARGRKDLPIVHNYTRGNKRKALDAAADDDMMAHAMSSYIKDWRSAGDTSDDYWSTWSQLHRAHWDGIRRDALELLPLDPLRVHVIGALLKIGGYRSSSNYVDVAKTKHVELGYVWGPDLDLARRRFLLSTRRGAGPPRQSEPLNFDLVASLELGWDPIVPGGPLNSHAVAVLSTFFLLREIEGAAANINHLTFNGSELTLTWSLPVSKTDYTARGCSRTWGCICPRPDRPTRICPYHVAVEHVAAVKTWLQRDKDKHQEFMTSHWDGEEAFDDEDIPLFPDANGKVVTAEAMVGLVDELARRSGEDIVNAEGIRRFGKHSWRSTGAVWLTGVMMIEVMKVQMLARWASPVVTHYTRLAPLKAITSDFRKSFQIREEKGKKDKDKVSMTKSIKKLAEQLKVYTAELDDLRKQIKLLDKRPLAKSYTINPRSGITHRILTSYEDAGIDARTFCKWPYIRQGGVLTADPPTARQTTCDTCLPALKASLP